MTPPVNWKISPNLTDYDQAHQAMLTHVEAMIKDKETDLLWALEHPPLYTAGTSAQADDYLHNNDFPVYETGRGGQYTYHGPGQRVVYVMLDLKQHMRPAPDVRRFVWLLEEWIIRTLAQFEITGLRRENRIGIWVVNSDGSEQKIAALGIRLKKWISFHGIAINVNPNLAHFGGIVPCGLSQFGVTSCHALGKTITMAELDEALKIEFKKLPFHCA